jgi:hypothetical protein
MSDYSTTEEKYSCAAHHLCKNHQVGKQSSNWIKMDDKKTLCSICNYYAHDECIVDKVYKTIHNKVDHSQPEAKICLHCALHKDGERTPLKPDEKHPKVPSDIKAGGITVANLGLKKSTHPSIS